MRLEPSPYVKRVKVNALPKVVGFPRVLSLGPVYEFVYAFHLGQIISTVLG
jgi:hypothetical protein